MLDRDSAATVTAQPKDKHGINSRTAQAVRDFLRCAGTDVPTTTVMAECGITRPTASRILHALVAHGEAEELAAPSGRQAKRWRWVEMAPANETINDWANGD